MALKAEQQRRGEKSAAKAGLRKHRNLKAYDQPSAVYVKRLKGESDRGVLVLAPTLIEDALEVAITDALPGYLSADHDSLFGFESPLGTFSRKTNMAKALGLISRPTADLIDLIRCMRNAAAHVQQNVSFSDSVVFDSVLALVSESTRELVHSEGGGLARDTFIIACSLLQQIVVHSSTKEQLPDSNIDFAITYIDDHQLIPVLECIRKSEVQEVLTE